MPNISITVKNKVARADRAIIVCDNSDYTAVFGFDDEWDAYDTKTARFVSCGKYTDVVLTGNECPIPRIKDTRSLTVGVYAGDLHTTTPAYISCVPSILCGNGIPADPTPDVYNQIMELLNKESGIWYPAVDDAGNMSWTRSMSETEPQPVNIKGQKGDAGTDGADGKDGNPGADGADGKSAYELAQDNGFAGTMQEWLASLVGADGANGADGNDGISPAVSVSAITGGNRITITDAEGAKTFDVMDGAQGEQGNNGADGKDYVLTDADKQEIAETAAGLVDVPSVQPDWNQNDDTQPDYVKNRPFYMGDPVETVLVEESTVTFFEIGGLGLYTAEFSSTFEATVGETCKVSWDGTVYECTCVYFDGNTVIGNLSIVGAGSDTGEPFFMGVENGVKIQIITADTSASHTISISGFAPEVVKIDEKYLPESSFTNAEWSNISNKIVDYKQHSLSLSASGEPIHIGTGSSFSGNRINDKLKFEDGMAYEINGSINLHSPAGDYVYTLDVNGHYTCSDGHVVFGSCYDEYYEEYIEIGLFTSSDNYYNYGKLCAFAVLSGGGGTYTFDINITVTEEAKQLPDICIGENIQRVGDDVIIPSSTPDSTKKFKITVDDSGAPTITDESDSTNTWKPTNLPTVTASDAGKFLRVSDTGEWVAETILSASGVSF